MIAVWNYKIDAAPAAVMFENAETVMALEGRKLHAIVRTFGGPYEVRKPAPGVEIYSFTNGHNISIKENYFDDDIKAAAFIISSCRAPAEVQSNRRRYMRTLPCGSSLTCDGFSVELLVPGAKVYRKIGEIDDAGNYIKKNLQALNHKLRIGGGSWALSSAVIEELEDDKSIFIYTDEGNYSITKHEIIEKKFQKIKLPGAEEQILIPLKYWSKNA
jgi:hypothetical protein